MRVPRPRRTLRGRRSAPAKAPGGQQEPAAPAGPTQPTPPKPLSDPSERVDGLRAWLVHLDRRVSVRTYVGAAILVLALAAAAVGLVLTLQLKQDAATKDEVALLRDQLAGVQQAATQAAQGSVRSLNQRLTTLESLVNRISADQKTTKRELQVVQGDIKELRSQISSSAGQPRTGPRSGGP
jgi:uncharacterized protein HemX